MAYSEYQVGRRRSPTDAPRSWQWMKDAESVRRFVEESTRDGFTVDVFGNDGGRLVRLDPVTLEKPRSMWNVE